MGWAQRCRLGAAVGLAMWLVGCAPPDAGVREPGAAAAGGSVAPAAPGGAAPPRVPEARAVAPSVGDTGDPLLAATAAYLSSAAGQADAWLLSYAAGHPPQRYWSEPGGCAAWFAGSDPPEGGGGLLAGSPPAPPAFEGYLPALRLARLDLVLRRVRCGTDDDPGSLPAKLAEAHRGWEALRRYAGGHGLAVPRPDPPAPVLPHPPVLLAGEGSTTVLVDAPVRAPGEPFLLTLVAASPGTVLTTLGPTGAQEEVEGSGTHIVDAAAAHRTTALRVRAVGPWELRLESFALMRRASLPGSIRGTDADVVLVDASLLRGDRAVVVDGEARVTVHRSQQPAQPLAGRLPDADVVVLEVDATGPWSVRTP
jgi:hypothetical protein